MRLAYLLFDCTEDATGSCSFDAMASVRPDRVPALAQEVAQVLRWAHASFGAPAGAGGIAEWDFDLQAVGEEDEVVLLAVTFDGSEARVALPTVPGRVTVSLTVAGSRAFADAFMEAFPEAD